MYRVLDSCQCHIPESPTPLLIPCLMIPMPNVSCPMTTADSPIPIIAHYLMGSHHLSFGHPGRSPSPIPPIFPPSPIPPHPTSHPAWHGMASPAWHRSCSYRVQRRTKLEPCHGPAMAQRSSVSLPRPPHHTRTTSSNDDSS